MTKLKELKLNTKETSKNQQEQTASTQSVDQKAVYEISLYADLLEYDYLQRCA
jgi:hypothetical protein